MSKLSVNMAYFCTNLVIITQRSFVRQGWCSPTYFPNFFLKSFQRSFENLPRNIFLRSFENANPFPGKEIYLRSFLQSFENVPPARKQNQPSNVEQFT